MTGGRGTAADVRDATGDDLEVVVDLHRQAFRGFFLTRLGEPFLRRYYRRILDDERGILLVADDERGDVVGFVAGFVDPTTFYRGLLRRWTRFTLPVLLGVARKPILLVNVLRNLRRISEISQARPGIPSDSCELSSIGVHPTLGGGGVGRRLVRAFRRRAADLGASEVFLSTDVDGNEPANAFYRALGFELKREYERPGGRRMNEYVYRLQGRSE